MSQPEELNVPRVSTPVHNDGMSWPSKLIMVKI